MFILSNANSFFFFKYERMFKIPKLYDKIEIITLQLLWNVSTNIAEKNLWRDNRRHFIHWSWADGNDESLGFE